MAESFIIEINLSDDIENVIRKCNANFHLLSRTSRKETIIKDADMNFELSGIVESIAGVEAAASAANQIAGEALQSARSANQTAAQAMQSATAANTAVASLRSIVENIQSDIISLKSRVSTIEGNMVTLDQRVKALEERPWPNGT